MKQLFFILCTLLTPLLAQAGGEDVVIEDARRRVGVGAGGAAPGL